MAFTIPNAAPRNSVVHFNFQECERCFMIISIYFYIMLFHLAQLPISACQYVSSSS